MAYKYSNYSYGYDKLIVHFLPPDYYIHSCEPYIAFLNYRLFKGGDYMNKLQSGIITASLLISSFALPLAAGAQGTQDNSTLNNQSQPGSTNNTNGGTAGRTQTNSPDNNQGFDWRWLLPLLAIPVIYLLTRRTDDRDEYREQSRYVAGAKGGKARRERDDEDYETDEE